MGGARALLNALGTIIFLYMLIIVRNSDDVMHQRHPVEHLMYYSCTWIPLFFLTAHPIHFLYCKFHADIAPIGGHDGYDEPSANGKRQQERRRAGERDMGVGVRLPTIIGVMGHIIIIISFISR